MRGMLQGILLATVVSVLTGQAMRQGSLSFLYTATPRYDPAAWMQGGERFPEGAHLVMVAPAGRRKLVPDFYASADAAISYDGRRALFSGRRTRQEPWQIYQIDLTTHKLSRVVTSPDNCIRPLYLPNEKVVYTRMTPSGSTIEVISSNGGVPDVLTHVPGRFLTDQVLHDGRILFEWNDDLFTVYPDGTGVESLRCDHGPRRSAAHQIASGDVIFNIAGGLARFTPALARQDTLPKSNLRIEGPIAELSPTRWLAAARSTAGGSYAIYQSDDLSFRNSECVEVPPAGHAVEPAVIAPRTSPRDFPSGLVPTRKTGNLLCLDVKESKDPISGSVHSVRFYSLDQRGASQVLGKTPIAADGSFFVEVPANRPVRMELLDADGTCLRAEDHWFWMRPSEQRICVGCHAGPERAPENKVPEILNQLLAPVKLLGNSNLTP